jgi:enoyl-CoA hydratase/carnithine racemase
MSVLEITREGRVLRLVLNRPEKRNALNEELSRALLEALEQANTNPGVGAILLTGQGDAFCAGMDLREAIDPHMAPRMAPVHERLFSILNRMRKPVVAAIRGAAIAGGTGLAANAHIVVASPDAQFGLTELRLGLWPVLIYPACVLTMGERRTLELALSTRIFSAAEAQEYGLVSELSDHPLVRAEKLVQELAERSPEALREGLEHVARIRHASWEDAGAAGLEVRARMMAHPDFTEGVTAFLEKRRPAWPSLT